jgi:hypothetical protein
MIYPWGRCRWRVRWLKDDPTGLPRDLAFRLPSHQVTPFQARWTALGGRHPASPR